MSEEKASIIDRITSAVRGTVTKADETDTDEVMSPEEEARTKSPMNDLLTQSPRAPKEGDLVEGKVSAVGRARVYVEIVPFGTGLIYGREFMNAREILRKVSVGDTIAAKVVDPGNEDGYIELSLKEARQALIWSDAE